MYSIGKSKRSNLEPNILPGPGDYQLLSKSIEIHNGVIAKAKKKNLFETMEIPGPGEYDSSIDTIEKRTSQKSLQ
jgi:hypothetical protein